MTRVCLYASAVLERTREMRERRSFVRRISIGERGMPGRERMLKEDRREVASIKSRSLERRSEGGRMERLKIT